MPTLPDARNIAQAEKVMRGTMEAHAPKGPEVKPTTPRATGSFAGPAAARVAGAGEYACDTIVLNVDAGRTAANWVKNTPSF